jgi:flagellar biogenesis protein FliO
MQVVETYRLEPRKTLYLIKLADQYLLIGSTADRLETLAGAPLDQEKIAAILNALDAPAAPGSQKPALSFSELLDQKPPPTPQPRPTTPQ